MRQREGLTGPQVYALPGWWPWGPRMVLLPGSRQSAGMDSTLIHSFLLTLGGLSLQWLEAGFQFPGQRLRLLSTES